MGYVGSQRRAYFWAHHMHKFQYCEIISAPAGKSRYVFMSVLNLVMSYVIPTFNSHLYFDNAQFLSTRRQLQAYVASFVIEEHFQFQLRKKSRATAQ